MRVKAANGDILHCNTAVAELVWNIQQGTFTHPMKVLNLEDYEAVLRMDWLVKFSVIGKTNGWSFNIRDKTVKLQGVVSPSLLTAQEATLEEIDQWHQVNDIWATVPAEIQLVLEKVKQNLFPLTEVFIILLHCYLGQPL